MRFLPGSAARPSQPDPCSWWSAHASLSQARTGHARRVLLELLEQRLQFAAAAGAGFGIAQSQRLDGIEHDARNDEAGVQLVVGGHDVPRRVGGARGAQAFFIRLHVLLPILPLRDIRGRELPILFGRFDPLEKALALLVFGEMQEELDDACALARQVPLPFHNEPLTFAPTPSFLPY